MFTPNSEVQFGHCIWRLQRPIILALLFYFLRQSQCQPAGRGRVNESHSTCSVYTTDLHASAEREGIVSFITVAGFLNGPGFQKMRDYLRRTCDDIWVIDCSPEGHQPEVNTRIFQGVQQPVCIVMASRSKVNDKETPATVHFRSLPLGHRDKKFETLKKLQLESEGWISGTSDWRDPFLPQSTGAWSSYPALEDLFLDNGSGMMPGRTWIIAPDQDTLLRRWAKLKAAPPDQMDELFTPHMNGEELGDRHSAKELTDSLPGFPVRLSSVLDDQEACIAPIQIGYRSFDRQWAIPDKRLINRPNPELWAVRSDKQAFLTAPSDRSPSSGPSLTLTALLPDLHHYAGRGGRAFPLWSDAAATKPNLKPVFISHLNHALSIPVKPEDLFSYIAGIAANPAFTIRFQPDLSIPGLRIPITSDAVLFCEAAEMGRRILWLHTFGERFSDLAANRPYGPPRVPVDPPSIPLAGRISGKPEDFPDSINYDAEKHRLRSLILDPNLRSALPERTSLSRGLGAGTLLT
jgi:hypothetical protein